MPTGKTTLPYSNAPRPNMPHAASGLAMLAVAVVLSGCMTDSRVVVGTPPTDYRQMHPIVLSQGQRSIDIFEAGGPGAIGARQIADVRAFAADYRSRGEGPLTIAMPASYTGARTLPAIRRALAEGGAPSARSTTYQPINPSAIAPVRLSFTTLKASVATQCGRWPTDAGGGASTLDGWQNVPWENFGCSYQQYVAAQVADPLDLVRGRQEAPGDATQRAAMLYKYRTGAPTAVAYPIDNTNKINTDLGN